MFGFALSLVAGTTIGVSVTLATQGWFHRHVIDVGKERFFVWQTRYWQLAVKIGGEK